MAGRVRKRPGLAPAGHPAIDQLRIVAEQHLWSQPQPLHHARPESLDQAVRPGRQLPRQRDPIGLFHVDRDRAPRAREGLSRQVLRARPLDPDHLRAVIGQHHDAEGTGADAGELDDSDAVEGTCHAATLAGRSSPASVPEWVAQRLPVRL